MFLRFLSQKNRLAFILTLELFMKELMNLKEQLIFLNYV